MNVVIKRGKYRFHITPNRIKNEMKSQYDGLVEWLKSMEYITD